MELIWEKKGLNLLPEKKLWKCGKVLGSHKQVIKKSCCIKNGMGQLAVANSVWPSHCDKLTVAILLWDDLREITQHNKC